MIKENLCTKKSFKEFNFKLWLVPVDKNNFIHYRECGLLRYKLLATFLNDDVEFGSKDNIHKLVSEKFKKDPQSTLKHKVEFLHAWCNLISYGDFVCCFDGVAKCFLGVVLGPCQNSSDRQYKYVRPVLWLGNVLAQKDMLTAHKKPLQHLSKKNLVCMGEFATTNILLNALEQCSNWSVPVLRNIAGLVNPNVLQEISKTSFNDLKNYQKSHKQLDLSQEHLRIAKGHMIYGKGEQTSKAAETTKTAAASGASGASKAVGSMASLSICPPTSLVVKAAASTTTSSLADKNNRQSDVAQSGSQVKQSMQQSDSSVLKHDKQSGITLAASLLDLLENSSAATETAFVSPAAATDTSSVGAQHAQNNGADQYILQLQKRIKSLVAANLCHRSSGYNFGLINENSSLRGNGTNIANLMKSIIMARIHYHYDNAKMTTLLTELWQVQGFQVLPFEANKYGFYALITKPQARSMQDCFCLLFHPSLNLCDRETLDFCRSLLAKYDASYVVLLSWSGFTEQVKESIAMEFLQFRLWTGEDLVQCYLKHYHLLSAETQQRIPLKSVWILR